MKKKRKAVRSDSVRRFKEGDWVFDAFTDNPEIVGIVVGVDKGSGVVSVDWNGAQPYPTQHDAQELMLSPFKDFIDRLPVRPKSAKSKMILAPGDKGKFVATHPDENLRGKDFKVVKTADNKVLMELVGEADMVWGTSRTFSSSENDEGDYNLVESMSRKTGRVAKKLLGKMMLVAKRKRLVKKLNALYHIEKGRVYKKTKAENDNGTMVCPRCKAEMESVGYKKGNPMNKCRGCGFMISNRSVV